MKKTYYLFNSGRLSRKDNTLKFTPVDENGIKGKPKYLPVESVEELYVFGNLDTNSPLLNFLGQKQVLIHFFDYYENYTGSFTPRDSLLSGKLLIKQVNHYSRPSKRIVIARKLIEGAAFNMLKNLRYYMNRGKEVSKQITKIEELRDGISHVDQTDELMGIEGNIRIIYYNAFDQILKDLKMEGRSRQPPLNEVNALISFGNMMCYTQCLKAIHNTQLNPTISYLHEPGERRFSLALDLSEIFKPLLVDRTIFKLLNRKEIQAKHFDDKMNGILIKDGGKKVFVKTFEERLKETIKHRKLNRHVSYKSLMRLECYKIIKHLLGDKEYEPFKAWW